MLKRLKRSIRARLSHRLIGLLAPDADLPGSGVGQLVRNETQRAVRVTPGISARMLPVAPEDGAVITPMAKARRSDPRAEDASEFEIPPEELWGVAPPYLKGGSDQMQVMYDHLSSAGFDATAVDAVLEFGCGTGRLLRHMFRHAYDHPVWGVDIDAERIAWAQEHLSPPFRFAACTTAPHLPFEDGTFDLVCAGSVFTHIADLADAWLLELLRVAKPGAWLYVTVQDQSWIRATRDRPFEDWLTGFLDEVDPKLQRLGRDASVITFTQPDGHPMVIHDRASLVAKWQEWADVRAVHDSAFFCQTGIVLSKRGGGAEVPG